MEHILKLLKTNKDVIIPTNSPQSAINIIKKQTNDLLILRQSKNPLSPISSYLEKNVDIKKIQNSKINISHQIKTYLISILQKKDSSIDSIFDEYFDRTEFVIRKNELYILISKVFIETVKEKNIVIVINYPELFKETMELLKVIINLKNRPRIILVEKITKQLSPYELPNSLEIHSLIFPEIPISEEELNNNISIQTFNTFYKWMCWDTCEKIAKILISKTPNILKSHTFVKKLVFSLIGNNKVEDAIDYLLDFFEEIKDSDNFLLLSQTTRLLSYLYSISQSRWNLTNTTAHKSYEFAIKSKDKKEILLSKALLFFIGQMNKFDLSNFFNELKNNKNQFKRLYHHITTFYYFFISMRDIITLDEILKLAKESSKTFKKEKDNFHLILYYHFVANIMTELGNLELAIKYDLKALKIAKYVNSPNISHIFNSLSHIYYTNDNFKKALYFSHKSLKESINEKDIKEICMSLVNIAYIYLITNNYKMADKIMDLLMKTKQLAKITNLPIHSNVKLWVMDIYIKTKLNKYSRFNNILLTLPDREFSNLDKEGKSFYYWGISILTKDPETKVKLLKKSLELITQNEFKYIEVKILKDLIKSLENLNQTEEAKAIKNEFIEKRKNHPLYEKILETETPIVKLPKIKIQENIILQQAIHQDQLISLQLKKNEIKFLNKIQEILLKENSEEKLIEKFINIIKNSFLVEGVILYDREKNRIYSTEELTEEDKYFIRNISKSSNGNLWLDNNQELKNIYFIPLIYSNKDIKGYLIIKVSNSPTSFIEEEISTLKISTTLLSNKLEILKNASRIEKMAKIDFLTGIPNRIEIDNTILKEIERCRRISGYCFSIAMIDLDNFKYYNDTFGHIVGDILLREFSKQISQHIRKTDFVGRFGGDEFVVIMPYTTREKALIAAKRWLGIFDTEFYIKIIQSYHGEKIQIPPDKKLYMSVGISDIIEAEYDVEKLFSIADERLYISKKSNIKIH